MRRALHLAPVIAFYGLTVLFTLFLSFEFFAHLLLPTPVVTQWAASHRQPAHAAHRGDPGTAARRTTRSPGQSHRLGGFHDLTFPVFNSTLYGVVALILVALHPERGRLFARGNVDRRLAAMAVLASVPLIAYAALETGKQRSGVDPYMGTQATSR